MNNGKLPFMTYSLCNASLLIERTSNLLCGRNFPTLRMGKDFNSDRICYMQFENILNKYIRASHKSHS